MPTSETPTPVIIAVEVATPAPAPLATTTTPALARVGAAARSAATGRVFTTYRRRLAANTRRRHDNDLARFVQFLAAAGTAAGDLASDPQAWYGISWGLVEAFVTWQLGQGFAIASVNNALSTVRTYAGLASKAGTVPPDELILIRGVTGFGGSEARHVDEDREVTRVGAKKGAPTLISTAQAAQLKATENPRDRLLMCLLLDHGLRIGEVEDLLVDGLDLAAERLTFFREKVNITQIHQLTPDTAAAAQVYLAASPASTGPLLRTARGGRWLDRNMRVRVAQLGAAIGLAGLSPHDCRHYWATVAIANGTDIKSLQDAGGWNSPAMPLRYAMSAAIANAGVKLPGQED